MSKSVDLFIDCADTIDELAARIGRLVQVEFRPAPASGTWSLDQEGLHADLHPHPYVDDGDLAFERYPYVLACRIAQSAHSLAAPETSFLRRVADALHREGLGTLLVHDLQYRDVGDHAPNTDGSLSSVINGAGEGAAAEVGQ